MPASRHTLAVQTNVEPLVMYIAYVCVVYSPTVAATRATEVEATDEGSDNARFSAFIWTIFMFGVLVGSTGQFYYLKLVHKLRNVAEKPVRDFGTVTDPVSTPYRFLTFVL